MHDSVMQFLRTCLRHVPVRGARILEVGSYDVNGSPRELFTAASEYIGIDMREGPGVDEVADVHDLPPLIFMGGAFDIVICCEMLEHDSAFWTSITEMRDVLKPGGYLILTARGIGFPLHDHPSDYWRFTLEAMKLLFAMADCEVILLKDDEPRTPGVCGLGRKR